MSFQHKNRKERDCNDQQREECGASDLPYRFENHLVVAERLAGALIDLELLVSLLHNHDGRIDQLAAGDCQPCQRHDVDAHSCVLQRNEGQKNGDRNGYNRNHGTWKVPKENQNDQDDRQDDFNQGRACIRDRSPDELRPVVHGDNLHAFRHARRDFFQARLHSIDDVEGIAALTHGDNARNHFAGAVKIGGSTANVGPKHNLSDVLDADWSAILIGQNNIFKILGRLHISAAADHVLGAAKFQQARPGFAVATADRIGYARNRDSIRTQAVGIDVDLILLREAAERSNFGHTGDRFQVILEIPILIGAKLRQSMFAGFVF